MASKTIQSKLPVQETVSMSEKMSQDVRAVADAFGVSVSEVIRLATHFGLAKVKAELRRRQV